jgi:N-acetylmuramoyl-L-alanine amidase
MLRFVVLPAAAVIAALTAGTAAGLSIGSPDSGHASHSAARPGVTTRTDSAARAGAAGAAGAGAARLPLAGRTVGIDPGHNGGNRAAPSFLGHQVWNGREFEDCDTVGAETDGGYTEALFNFRVAGYLRADLVREGALVVLTRTADDGTGPCVDRRASIINKARADVSVDIHADGGPADGRGFAILEPVSDGPNDDVISASDRLGADIRAAMLADTTMPLSTYDGTNGINHRDDLAGLNLTRVPKVLIEVGNMRNATDAKLLTSASFQQRVARTLLAAIIRFLR